MTSTLTTGHSVSAAKNERLLELAARVESYACRLIERWMESGIRLERNLTDANDLLELAAKLHRNSALAATTNNQDDT